MSERKKKKFQVQWVLDPAAPAAAAPADGAGETDTDPIVTDDAAAVVPDATLNGEDSITEASASPTVKTREVNFVPNEISEEDGAKLLDGTSSDALIKPAGEDDGEDDEGDEEDGGPVLSDILPQLLSYRTQASRKRGNQRPTISSLLYGQSATIDEDEEKPVEEEEEEYDDDNLRRFGMWDGVFARSLLNIFGVIMFIRLGYVFALAGIGYGVVVILLSVFITTTTTLSLSAICTNGEVKGGGAYYMISRALGPQFGGIIGIMFSIANAVAIAIYVVGFAEALEDQSGGAADIRVFGIACICFVLLLCLAGVDWVIKVQLGLLALLIVCILSVIIGLLLSPQEDIGFVGVSTKLFEENFGPAFEPGKDFVHVLGIFFPAVTGIMAGANISGEVKNPGYSIPWGTLYAVFVSAAVYILLGVLLASGVEREFYTVDGVRTTDRDVAVAAGLDLDEEGGGLRWNNFIMADLSFWGPLIFAGIYAATLSSAIASLVGAPRILQAVAKDNLIPAIKTFADGHGPNEEPWKGYFVSFAIAFVFVAIGDLNFVAPLITSFFMISYFFVNFACFAASYSGAVGWRPSFKLYNKWVSLLGGIGCLIIMFLINWVVAFVTVCISFMLYFYLSWTDPDVSWGSAPEALRYNRAHDGMRRLDRVRWHIKNFRPQYLVMCGNPMENKSLVLFANQLRKGQGLMMYGNVLVCPLTSMRDLDTRQHLEMLQTARRKNPLQKMKIKGFMETVVDTSYIGGARSMMQLSGMSKLRPNILLVGFKRDWASSTAEEVNEYLDVLRYAFAMGYGVEIVQNQGKLLVPYSVGEGSEKKKVWDTMDVVIDAGEESDDEDEDEVDASGNVQSQPTDIEQGLRMTSNTERTFTSNDRTIDVWWMYDDGGLTLLVPYLLRMHKYWAGAKMRIITVSVDKDVINKNMIEVAGMMKKFRIDAESLCVQMDVDSKGNPTPKEETMQFHTSLCSSFTDNTKSHRTLRHLKIGELMKETSANADLIFVSMPIPDIEVNPFEYMGWLECISNGLPPMVFIRGNHENVLTFEL